MFRVCVYALGHFVGSKRFDFAQILWEAKSLRRNGVTMQFSRSSWKQLETAAEVRVRCASKAVRVQSPLPVNGSIRASPHLGSLSTVCSQGRLALLPNVKRVEGSVSPSQAEPTTQVGVRHEAAQRVLEGSQVPRRRKYPCHAILDDLPAPTHIGRDNCEPHRRSLHGCSRKPLPP